MAVGVLHIGNPRVGQRNNGVDANHNNRYGSHRIIGLRMIQCRSRRWRCSNDGLKEYVGKEGKNGMMMSRRTTMMVVTSTSTALFMTTMSSAGSAEAAMEVTVPSTQQLIAPLTVMIPFAYWWLIVVPSERRSIAKSKRKGALKNYLDELDSYSPEAASEEEVDGSSKTNDRFLERWFYTDWLEKRNGKGRRQNSLRRTSVDGSKQPAFFSLDNPLIVTSILMTIGVAISTLQR